MRWHPGDVVALRDVWFGSVWRAVAGITIEDTDARSVFWLPAGAEASYPVDGEGAEIRMPRADFERAGRRTKRTMLVVCEPAQPWTLWLHLDDAGSFDHWYVNFEHYAGRTAVAYDARDHKLDLIVDRTGALRWKDEDELVEAARLGLVDETAVRRDAAGAVARPPWPTGWEDYRPDGRWDAPELPAGWDVT